MSEYYIALYANADDVNVCEPEYTELLENTINDILSKEVSNLTFQKIKRFWNEENPLLYAWEIRIQDSDTVNAYNTTRDLYGALYSGLKKSSIVKNVSIRLATNYARVTSVDYVGKNATEHRFDSVYNELIGAVYDMIAWRDFDDNAIYSNGTTASLDKALRNLAKELGIAYNKTNKTNKTKREKKTKKRNKK